MPKSQAENDTNKSKRKMMEVEDEERIGRFRQGPYLIWILMIEEIQNPDEDQRETKEAMLLDSYVQ